MLCEYMYLQSPEDFNISVVARVADDGELSCMGARSHIKILCRSGISIYPVSPPTIPTICLKKIEYHCISQTGDKFVKFSIKLLSTRIMRCATCRIFCPFLTSLVKSHHKFQPLLAACFPLHIHSHSGFLVIGSFFSSQITFQ